MPARIEETFVLRLTREEACTLLFDTRGTVVDPWAITRHARDAYREKLDRLAHAAGEES